MTTKPAERTRPEDDTKTTETTHAPRGAAHGRARLRAAGNALLASAVALIAATAIAAAPAHAAAEEGLVTVDTEATTPAPEVPGVPANFSISGVHHAENYDVVLSWDDPDDPSIDYYEIMTDCKFDCVFERLPSTTAATTSHTLTGYSYGEGIYGTTYHFMIRAVNETGPGEPTALLTYAANAPPTSTSSQTPAAPSGFTISGVHRPGNYDVVLTWDDPGDASIDYYEMQHYGIVGESSEFERVASSSAATTTHTVTGIAYHDPPQAFRVRAVNEHGAGTASAYIVYSAAAPPAPPLEAVTGLSASANGNLQTITLTWDAIDDPWIAYLEYRYRLPDGAEGDVGWRDWSLTSGSLTSFTKDMSIHISRYGNGPWRFQVRPLSNSGRIGPESEVASVTVPPHTAVLPEKPAGFTYEVDGRNITWSWDDPDNPDITGYDIYLPHRDKWTELPGSSASTTSFGTSNAYPGYAVERKVRARTAAGAGPESETLSVIIPKAPREFVATPGDGEVTLTWTAPGHAGITGWELRTAAESTPWTDDGTGWAAIDGADAETASHTVTGLDNGVLYRLQLRAMSGAVAGMASPVAEAQPSVPLEVRMTGSVPQGKGGPSEDLSLSRSPDQTQGGGCPAEVSIEFLDADGNAVAVDALAATDFTVTNGSAGTPAADADGLGWTVPVRAAADKGGLLRVRLPATAHWQAAEQVFHIRGASVCVPAARWELASLWVDDLFVSPSFTSTTTSYTSETTDADAVVLAEAVYADATVTVTPEDADEEADGHEVALAEGETRIEVTVTPGDGSAARTYTVTVTREEAVLDPGVLTGFELVDASTDRDLGAVTDGGTVSVSAARIYGIRVGVKDVIIAGFKAYPEVGSVVLTLAGPGETDTHTQTENVAPYSLYGDAPGGASGRAEHGRALAAGSYTLTATAYAERGGAGEVLGTLTAAFTVEVETPLTGFVLLDASDQSKVAALADGAEIDLGGRSGGSFAIRANVASSATVGSVRLSLSGAKTASAMENLAPYSLWGDHDDGNGGRALDGAALPAGTYALSATAYGGARGEGETLDTRSVSFEVLAPAALSVADARAEEGTDAALDFEVALDRSSTGTVTVAYATADGTATAGDDYTATSGTLTFAAGETLKTVSVPVLEDDHDEGSETLTLRLTSPTGATIADGEATGTITNSDHMPEAWLARFGRTVTGQVLEAVEARLTAPRQAGARMSLAGQTLPSWRAQGPGGAERAGAESRAAMTACLARTGPDSGSVSGLGGHRTARFGAHGGLEPLSRALTRRDLVAGTSFALTGGSAGGGGFASLWGRGSMAGFDGREGALAVDGEVATGLVGADWASGPGSGAGGWTAGLAVGHSTGTGGYRNGGCDQSEGGNCAGGIEGTVTGVYPYAGLGLTKRLSAWAAAGWGSGEVTVTPEGQAGMTADLTMSMGAAGLRGEVLVPEDGNGLALAVKGDARFTRTSSDAVRSGTGNLEAADADAWLVRAGIEGSRRFVLGSADNGASVTPSFELGLRRDGGDAETGLGADFGAGVAFADRKHGLAFDARARALLAHEAGGFREWGASASLGWDPRPHTARGLSLTLTQSWGAPPSGGMDALLSRETLAGLAANGDTGGFEASPRFQGEVGYGLPAFGGGFTGTPNLGFGLSESARDWRIGWKLGPADARPLDFQLSLEATRREPANDPGSGSAAGSGPEHGVMLRGSVRW